MKIESAMMARIKSLLVLIEFLHKQIHSVSRLDEACEKTCSVLDDVYLDLFAILKKLDKAHTEEMIKFVREN